MSAQAGVEKVKQGKNAVWCRNPVSSVGDVKWGATAAMCKHEMAHAQEYDRRAGHSTALHASESSVPVSCALQAHSPSRWQLTPIHQPSIQSVVLAQAQHAVYPVELQLQAVALPLQAGIQLHLC